MCFIYCRICIGKHESLTNHTPLKKVLFSVFSGHGRVSSRLMDTLKGMQNERRKGWRSAAPPKVEHFKNKK
jgi:hypothetical protein